MLLIMILQKMHQRQATVVAADDGFNMLPDVMQSLNQKSKVKKQKGFELVTPKQTSTPLQKVSV